MADAFLSREEIETLTGYKIGKCQIRWLEESGVKFYIARTGRPVVPRSAIDGGANSADDLPPFELGHVA